MRSTMAHLLLRALPVFLSLEAAVAAPPRAGRPAAAVLLAQAAAGTPAREIRLYVAPNGSDAWSGRLPAPNKGKSDGPFATLAGAKAGVRALRRAGGAAAPVRVIVQDGSYPLGEPLVFTPEDSGSEAAPISYEAAAGAKPVVSGGRRITGWQRGEGALWTARIPEVVGGKWRFNELFVNGRRCTRARHPNTDDYWFQAAKNLGVKDGVGSFAYQEKDVRAFSGLEDVEIHFLRMWDTSRYRVLAVDESASTVRFRMPAEVKQVKYWGDRGPYLLENSRDFVDSPGEWFLDAKTGTLTLWPFPGVEMAKATAVAPALSHLLRFEGTAGQPVQHLAFRGLAFEHAGWSLPENGYDGHQADVAIGACSEADYARSLTFERCRFANQGRYALRFRKGCRGNRVDACEFVHLGGGSVMLGDVNPSLPPEPDETRDNAVTHCHIHHTGEVYPSSVGLWVGYASHNRIAGNHIHDTPYSGISVGWGWTYDLNGAHHNLIEGNHIHNVVQLLGDAGAIYTLSRQPGTVIRGNVIHDVDGYHGWGQGIYMDNNSSEILVEGNLVARTIGASLTMGAVARDNQVRNNVLALSATHAIEMARCKENTVEGNILYLKEGCVSPPGAGLPEALKAMDRNLFYLAGAGELVFPLGMTFAEWQAEGYDKNALVADPLFADAAQGDFSLRPGSPALVQLGFRPLAGQSVVGPPPPDRRDDARLVRLFDLHERLRTGKMTPQMVLHPRKASPTPPPAGVAPALAPNAPAGGARPPSLDGLVAWWPLDEVLPDVPNWRMHGQVRPGVAPAEGIAGGGLRFDGQGAKLDVPYAEAVNLTDALSITAWIRCEPKQGRGMVGILERPQIYRFMMAETEAPYSLSLSLLSEKGGFFGANSKREVAAGAWVFVAGTYDSATGKSAVYLNGKLSGEAQTTAGTKLASRKGTGLQIGLRDTQAYFAGALDEVRLYSRALTPAEVSGEYERLAGTKR